MTRSYQHLGVFSDWVDEARRQRLLYPLAVPGPKTQQLVRDCLGFCKGPETPMSIRCERQWTRDGLIGEEVSWSVGYGPRTHAYVLKPEDVHGPLPAVVALHDHGGFKFYGKEKIADGPDDPPPVLQSYRRTYYNGRAYANALAKEGFLVLVHDTFLWGSRRFPLETMPPQVRDTARAVLQAMPPDAVTPPEIAEYNTVAAHHEHWIAKYANLLGTNIAGVVCHEDRLAVNYLLTRADVLTDSIGCLGLSGGGNRAAMLQATHDHIQAAVIVGLMTTYEELLDRNMSHTWMMFPYNWARYGDWSDLAACRAPSPLLVQYDLEDHLFTVEGMEAAHKRLSEHYARAGQPAAYTGRFYPGPHKFDLQMQTDAFAWLKQWLGPTRGSPTV